MSVDESKKSLPTEEEKLELFLQIYFDNFKGDEVGDGQSLNDLILQIMAETGYELEPKQVYDFLIAHGFNAKHGQCLLRRK